MESSSSGETLYELSAEHQPNPWQTLSVREVYENPWIRLTHREVLNPSGNPGQYGVVHFKNIAIAIVPIDKQGFTWLVGQYRYTLDRFSWEVPEGGGSLELPPLESAKRELQEETGITASCWTVIPGELHLSNSVTNERGLIFVAQDLNFGKSAPEDTEKLDVIRIPFDMAVRYAMEGVITDALAVIALLKTNEYIRTGLIKI